MITKAQLDSAIRDLETRIGKGIDLKLEARVTALKDDLAKAKADDDGRRAATEGGIFDELDKLKARLERLEEEAGLRAKEGAARSVRDEDDVITDDFSS